jgi:type II secretory pathway component GspD/PulD (secretin)
MESDMLARVMDGETLVVAGFTREREVKEEQKKPAGFIGGTWFSKPTVVTVHKQSELVILLTAKIVAGVAGQ